MKFKRKIFIPISILLVITLIRESGIANFNLYKSNLIKQAEHHIANNELKMELKKSGFNAETKFPNENYTDKTITIVDIDKKEAPKENNNFDIIIKKINIPISIIPLYTNVDYEIEATINDCVSITKTDSINMYLFKNNVNGKLTIKGNLKAFGFLSNYEIKRLILADYKENLKKEFKNYLSS